MPASKYRFLKWMFIFRNKKVSSWNFDDSDQFPTQIEDKVIPLYFPL